MVVGNGRATIVRADAGFGGTCGAAVGDVKEKRGTSKGRLRKSGPERERAPAGMMGGRGGQGLRGPARGR